jgi:CheY-like chemotaxis protein
MTNSGRGSRPRASRVLVVEDDYFVADELREEFEERGFLVVGPVPTVAAALHLIDLHGDLDGATLDVSLGHESAFPVADALRERNIPFVFLTGYSGWNIPERYEDALSHRKPANIQAVVNSLFPK